MASVLMAALVLPAFAQAACTASIAADAPDTRYAAGGDTVTDKYTGLMWTHCSEGLSGADCSGGTLATYTWDAALAQVQALNAQGYLGYHDWRLPTKNELVTLLERKCAAPAINAAVFQNTPVQSQWTATPYALDATRAWYVDFNSGDVFSQLKSSVKSIRLVRGGS